MKIMGIGWMVDLCDEKKNSVEQRKWYKKKGLGWMVEVGDENYRY